MPTAAKAGSCARPKRAAPSSSSISNEVAQFCDNPADFPVNKVNIRTLQMTSGLSSDQQLIVMRKVWNTNGFEDEAIIGSVPRYFDSETEGPSIAQRKLTWLLPVSGEVPRRAEGR